MKIVLHSRSALPRQVIDDLDARECALDELLSRADFVSLHAPSTAETRHLINRDRLSLMPAHAVLINTARGDIVDEHELARALDSGAIAAAGLDVYEAEPAVAAPLLELDNVVLLPHLGSATVETRTAMGMKAVENLRAHFRGDPPPDLLTPPCQ